MLTQTELEQLVWKAMLDWPSIGALLAEDAEDKDQANILLNTFKEILADKLSIALHEKILVRDLDHTIAKAIS